MGILNVMPKAGWANGTFLADTLKHACGGGGCPEARAGKVDCMVVMPGGLWYAVPLTS